MSRDMQLLLSDLCREVLAWGLSAVLTVFIILCVGGS